MAICPILSHKSEENLFCKLNIIFVFNDVRRTTNIADVDRKILQFAPFVGIVQKGIAKEPRIAAMRGIMMARTKPIKIVEPAKIDSLTEIVNYEMPKPRTACKFVDPENVKQLVEMLQNEAKVI